MRTTGPSGHARRQPDAAPLFSARHVPALGSARHVPLLRSARHVPALLRVLGVATLSLVVSCFSGKGTIGAVISQDADSGRLFLREVPPKLAAARAELKPGDEILLIDGLDVRRMDAQQINAALSGEVDSPVKLTIIREEQVLRVTLERTEAQRLAKKPAKSPELGP
jgi:S1-C subfamily serine protease